MKCPDCGRLFTRDHDGMTHCHDCLGLEVPEEAADPSTVSMANMDWFYAIPETQECAFVPWPIPSEN